MSSAGERQRYTFGYIPGSITVTGTEFIRNKGRWPFVPDVKQQTGKQLTVSESHPMDRKTGSYREGGPFYTSRVTDIFKYPFVEAGAQISLGKIYHGPLTLSPPTLAEKEQVGFSNIQREFGDKNESQLSADGATAISLCNPINPASNLGTGLSETMLEGIPSLPGIKLWQDKTRFLKGIGSEYLNYQFGWAPLKDEVESVRDAARQHRDLLQQYHRGEGSDTHRRFEFPSQVSEKRLPETAITTAGSMLVTTPGTRQISLVKETKKWFEGCFTYGLPSSTDSWRKALGFGSNADQLFGISLSPDILWELTPWSWAVDWFSNAGDVINNVTNFGLAGLVMRYGYMMEESIERVVAEGVGPKLRNSYYGTDYRGIHFQGSKDDVPTGSYSVGTECVTKRRFPANPFGFGIGWQDLSPTQLAITAALGITRLL